MTEESTLEKGNKFESKSLDIIKRVIENEQLGHMSKHLKICSQKEYYSALRKSNIKFDLTIEVWPPGASKYTLIYIIECKDYETRVPVNKIEDFYSKIQQVSGVNVKGIFISNSPLQKSGFNIADSIGMMVIIGESADNYKIELYKNCREKEQLKIPFINNTFDIGIIDEGTKLIEKIVDKAILNSLEENTSDSKVSFGIDRLSSADIEEIAKTELNKIDSCILSEAVPLTEKTLIDYIQNNLGVEIDELAEENKALGLCDIHNKKISINKSIKGTKRLLFILAHELGHFVLHQKLFIGQTTYDSFEDSEYNFRTNKHDLKNPKNWVEWQANYFASSFLLPKETLVARMLIFQTRLGIPKGKIYVDDQIDNINNYSLLIKKLSSYFQVTKTTIIYKLKEINMITENSRLKSIRDIIHEYKDEFFID
jgi:Zn-dependent peptidase ImmA (M78 family)